MYIPRNFETTDKNEMLAFMQRFSFATIVTTGNNRPTATHLPFTISVKQEQIILTAHFAKANQQWNELMNGTPLVIFTEPHAYISPSHYDREQSVPTWNYIAVHAYGTARIVTDQHEILQVLESMIMQYDIDYKKQWDGLPMDFKLKMVNGIVAFEITVTDLQGNKKLSQNKTTGERDRIITTLSTSAQENDRLIANYMKDLGK